MGWVEEMWGGLRRSGVDRGDVEWTAEMGVGRGDVGQAREIRNVLRWHRVS